MAESHALDDLRRQLLEARDARQALVARLAADRPGETLVFLSMNVPGPEKSRPGLVAVRSRARAALAGALPGCRVVAEGRDALGPWLAAAGAFDAAIAKRRCIGLEESLAGGRLVDLDVFGPGLVPVTRAALGLPPRRCLACEQPAVECIRLQRHTIAELSAAVGRLLGDAP